MADRWLTFDCYGTIADWNAGMGGPLEKVTGRDAGRLLNAYHQAELELEAGPGWMPYREVLTAGLASAARHEGITLPEGGEATFVRAWPDMPMFEDAGPALTALREQGLAAGHPDELRRRPVRRHPVAPACAVRHGGDGAAGGQLQAGSGALPGVRRPGSR